MLHQREMQRSINFRKAQKLNEQLWKQKKFKTFEE